MLVSFLWRKEPVSVLLKRAVSHKGSQRSAVKAAVQAREGRHSDTPIQLDCLQIRSFRLPAWL